TREPQLALRNNTLHTPRLTRTTTPTNPTTTLNPNGTILITGATGALGKLIAHHLITHHHITHLHLVSRRGPNAPGATQLHQELTALGAHITLTAADVTNPHHITQILNQIPTQHPLTGIIHAAGTLDDGIFTALTPHRTSTVLHPKTDAAHHLHHATQHLTTLTTFILFSSV
ncbi:SDR family NAD(P)-dependent oxidoreductase, partial [Streptomyces bambusae]|uniref:SDR family NAD(P)-dependent oxidoreductase n=1 Tax=Streptomyces bambusae TaxID=1550616 RepID=UPI001CFF7464